MIVGWSLRATEIVTVSVVNTRRGSEVDMVISPVLDPRESQAGVLTSTVKVLAPQKLYPS